MIRRLTQWLLTTYYAQMYAYCRSNEYLASQRGEQPVAAEWARLADGWWMDWWKSGSERRLR